MHRRTPRVLVAIWTVALATACGRFEGYGDLADRSACDPSSGGFTTEIDNPFFPLPAGHRVTLEGEEGSTHLVVRITALDETETVAGVETRVVEEYESKDGAVVEISRNFFAQAQDGTVCYFGEHVDIYDGSGNVSSHTGEWRAGEDGNEPGIFMPPVLEVGLAFQQEVAPGIAEDQAKVIALGESVEVPAGTFDETATLEDSSPIDGSRGTKVYAKGIGLIVDGPAELTRFTTPTP